MSGHDLRLPAGHIKVKWTKAVLRSKLFPGIQKGGEVFDHHIFFSFLQNQESQKLGEVQRYQSQSCKHRNCTGR